MPPGLRPPQSNYGGGWLSNTAYEYVHVVVPDDAPPAVRRAGEVFVELWNQCTAREITMSPENEGRLNVWLGEDPLAQGLVEEEEVVPLGPEGYLVRAYEPPPRAQRKGAVRQVIIAANTPEGTLNGVYAFFRHVLNARWLTNDHSIIPRALRYIREFDFARQPFFEVREVAYRARWPEARAWHEAHAFHSPMLPGGFGVDTLEALLPPPQFPACYRDGRLCWSAPETGEAAVAQALALYETGADAEEALRQRRARVFGHSSGRVCAVAPAHDAVSCACDGCSEGAVAAQLRVVNAVAEALDSAFPLEDLRVHTLFPGALPAAPGKMRAARNVILQVTNAGCDFAQRLDDEGSPENVAFLRRLDGWARLGGTLHLWDYACSTVHPLLPFPNTRLIQRNLQVLSQHEVRGVYAHGWSDAALPAELAELRAYLYARFLRDPDLRPQDVLGFFLERYYGPAAPHIADYLALNEEHAAAHSDPVSPDALPAWVTDDWLAKARDCFANALAAEKLSDEERARVERVGVTVQLVALLKAPEDGALESLLQHVERVFPGAARGPLRDLTTVLLEGRAMTEESS